MRLPSKLLVNLLLTRGEVARILEFGLDRREGRERKEREERERETEREISECDYYISKANQHLQCEKNGNKLDVNYTRKIFKQLFMQLHEAAKVK